MTSCEQSIADLLGDTGGGSGLDTVPVILYCKEACKPFKGYGSRKADDECEIKGSFFFRVKSVDDNGCAIVELLLSVRHQDIGGIQSSEANEAIIEAMILNHQQTRTATIFKLQVSASLLTLTASVM